MDGSSLRLPKSEELIEKFGLFETDKNAGQMPVLGRVSVVMDLLTGMICSARLSAWSVGEQSMAQEQLPEIVSQFRSWGQEKMLFVYDRGYPSMPFFQQHISEGVDFLFRLQRGCYKSLWERVNAGENDFEYMLESNKNDIKAIKLRIIVLKLKDGSKEVLATSLFDKDKFPIASMGSVYGLRWQIEECYKRLKVCAEIENFSGNRLESILQEFWAHLAMSNLLTAFMADEQAPWDAGSIPEYRLNFSILG